jgi:hypothetical protein
VYESEPFRAVFGQAYYLYIRYQQQDYLAVTFMVPVAPLPPLEVEEVGNLLRYKPGTSNNPAMEEVRLDWSAVEGYLHLPPEETRAQLYYYTLETLDVPQLFAPEQQEVLFPRGTKIVRRNYSLSAEQRAFVRSFLFETQWQGSPFDAERANVLTNMQGGALGYFAANTVVSDSTVVE